MLLRFQVENFRSLKDRQELSLIATADRTLNTALHAVAGHNVLPCAAFYGANASGKSNILKALFFMENAVRASYQSWQPDGPVPHEPFRLDPTYSDRPSHFEADLEIDGIRYAYGFKLNARKVEREWLFAYPGGRRQKWFTREDQHFKFSKNFRGENSLIRGITRSNCLFLSTAAQNNHAQAMVIYRWFVDRLHFGPAPDWLERTTDLCSDSAMRRIVGRIISVADFGVERLDVQEIPLSAEEMRLLARFRTAFQKDGQVASIEEVPSIAKTLAMYHRGPGGETPMPLAEESAGTKAFVTLLGPVFVALAKGHTLCIDELESSLHPLLAKRIVKLFQSPGWNQKGAQLIFATHDTHLLDQEILRRDQIWLTEKDQFGATHLAPLSDFSPRKGENLERGYLQGRYGAIPFLGDLSWLPTEAQQPA